MQLQTQYNSLPLNIWFLCIRGSASVIQPTVDRGGTVVFTVERKTTCDWTHSYNPNSCRSRVKFRDHQPNIFSSNIVLTV